MTGLICSKGGGGERCVEIRDIQVPDLWHTAKGLGEMGNPLTEEAILKAWHLAHDMKKALQAIDKVLPKMLGRATDRLKEYITDNQEMGDIDGRAACNLEQWAEELAEFIVVFEYFPMGGDFMSDERSDAELYIGEALRLAEEIRKEIEPEKQYTNYYECPCGNSWSGIWSCSCNDKCPKCNLEIEPMGSEEVTP